MNELWASPAIHTYVERPREAERGLNKPVSWLAGGLAGWLPVAQRASKYNCAPAVGYCLFLLSGHFGPRGTLGLQLSGIVWFCCLAISGLEGHRGSSCGFCVVFLSGNFGPRGKLGSSCRLLSCLFERGPERPREARRGPEKPREPQRSPESLREAQRRTERPREAQRGPESPT